MKKQWPQNDSSSAQNEEQNVNSNLLVVFYAVTAFGWNQIFTQLKLKSATEFGRILGFFLHARHGPTETG